MGTRAQVLPHNFEFLPNFHKCFYNSIGTWKKCFLFPLLNNLLKTIKKINLLIFMTLWRLQFHDVLQYTRTAKLYLFYTSKVLKNASEKSGKNYLLLCGIIRNLYTQTRANKIAHLYELLY